MASIRHLRNKYLKAKGAARSRALRSYLRAKARAYRFDSRMMQPYNPPSNISKGAKGALMRGYAAGLVVTSTTNGKHAPNSYHYQGRAVDMGVRPNEVGTQKGMKRMVNFQIQEVTKRPRHYKEVFGPNNLYCIKNGNRISLIEGSALETLHDNHVHLAV